MAAVTKISPWPGVPDCLAWSDECILAVALGDHVELLIPKLTTRRKTSHLSPSNRDEWDRTRIKVDLFSDAEVPLDFPASFSTWSVGAELSESNVVALSWSPLGLAKSRRCALAVLTSNHVLSIFESEDQPTNEESWKRVLIVNRALDKFILEQYPESSKEKPGRTGRFTSALHIHGFAWAQSTNEIEWTKPDVYQEAPAWGDFFLSIATRAHGIIIVRIKSPHDPSRPDVSEWAVSVVSHMRGPAFPIADAPPPNAMLFDDYVNYNKFLSRVAWSPWSLSVDGPQLTSVLALSSGTDLMLSRVEYNISSGELSVKYDGPGNFLSRSIALRPHGPLAWCPKLFNDTFYLVSFTCTDAVCFAVPTSGSIEERVSIKEGAIEWHDPSGLAFALDADGISEVHFASFLGAPNAAISSIKIPFDRNVRPAADVPPWKALMLQSQALFSEAHDLSGNVSVRTRGMAASPLGDYIACCMSLHPSDMLEYGVRLEQKCDLSVTPQEESEDRLGVLEHWDRRKLGSESILYSLKKWVQAIGADDGNITEDRVQDKLQELRGDAEPQGETTWPFSTTYTDTATSSFNGLVRALTRLISTHHNFWQNRASILVDLLYRRTSVQSESGGYAGIASALSNAVVHMCTRMAAVKQCGKQVALFRAAAKVTSKEGSAAEIATPEVDEKCKFCGNAIKFEHYAWAKCGNGHVMVRCALSFQAIQRPGLSRSCSLCGKQYLKEDYLLQHEKIDEGARKPPKRGRKPRASKADVADQAAPLTLFRILLAVCDICVYCGGKYIRT
ncbi:transcription factor IIIC subunit delta N-term-domain-containing protein [Lineolata rhizophorae]|uniref:Transcription factor IIIC subunit delta N-term-domain-containing protein n=1 Tax=Lineolata rhizophorae TaxID=578093 RepID=A0A6A6P0F7_9PEZI|nr:transcription factor IIIC subunit delta N-term-domain-containing protein [Lineolata rhizophorae]